MDQKELEKKFWAAIEEAVSEADAVMDDGARRFLSEKVELAAQELRRERDHSAVVEDARRAYRSLIKEAVAQGAIFGMDRSVSTFTLGEAIRELRFSIFWL